jgi:exopolysaccharide production protein ExoZ
MKKLLALQGLRALAAAMVVQIHGVDNYVLKALNRGADDPGMGRGFGGLGVQLFFCISGYIILKSAENLPANLPAALNFIKRRLIRVVPIYWLVTFFYIVKFHLEGHPALPADIWKSLLFIPFTNDSGLMRPVLGVAWTLSYEMFFYALMAVAVAMFARWRVVMVITALLSLTLMGQLLDMPPNPIRVTSLLLLANHWLLFFVVGLVVARLPSHLPMPQLAWQPAFALAAATIAGHMVLSQNIAWYAMHADWMALGACGLAVLVATNTRDVAPGRTSIWSNWLVKAGDGSYSTYLVHGTILGFAARQVGKVTTQDWSMSFSFAMVLVCSAVGYLVYKFIETPMINTLTKMFVTKGQALGSRQG